MPVIVENGTGLLDADSYVSLAEFKSWCSNRGYRWEEAEDFQIEEQLRLATGWIDTYNRYKGTRLKAEQTLEFPRADLVDWSSHTITGVPHRVKQACCELAYKGLSEPLYVDLDRGGKITSESVGPLSVSYAADAPAGKVFMFAANLLKPYVRDPSQLKYSPWQEPEEGTHTTLGMHDYPGTGGFTYEDVTKD